VQDVSEVAWIAGTHIDPQRDIQFTRGPMDDLENASDLPAYGSKMGIDATRKWPGEGFTREWPRRVVTTDSAARSARDLLKAIVKEK
jgi:4-hydroxy-3-polyprenylbenzoate decarboxylase